MNMFIWWVTVQIEQICYSIRTLKVTVERLGWPQLESDLFLQVSV